MYYYFLGGPRIMPVRYTINFFKGMTLLYILFLMYYFNNYSQAIYIYLFIHASYGFAWVIKDALFPDASFKPNGTIGSHIVLSIVLFGYWCIPLSIVSGYGLQ